MTKKFEEGQSVTIKESGITGTITAPTSEEDRYLVAIEVDGSTETEEFTADELEVVEGGDTDASEENKPTDAAAA
jgi:hypothetical protein